MRPAKLAVVAPQWTRKFLESGPSQTYLMQYLAQASALPREDQGHDSLDLSQRY